MISKYQTSKYHDLHKNTIIVQFLFVLKYVCWSTNLIRQGHAGEEVGEDGFEELDVLANQLWRGAVVEGPQDSFCVSQTCSFPPNGACIGKLDHKSVPPIRPQRSLRFLVSFDQMRGVKLAEMCPMCVASTAASPAGPPPALSTSRQWHSVRRLAYYSAA